MKYKTTQKDRYGNMRSLEIETDGNNLEVPPMNSGIPQYEAVGGLAENHPGDPKGSDTVPAWLTPGEFVVNKEATDLFGPQIKQMNDIGREIQDGNMSPDQAPPVYASEGKLLKEWKDLLKSREGGVRLDVYSPTKKPYRKEEWEPTSGIGHLLPIDEYTFEKYGQGGVQGPFADEAAANRQFEEDFAIALAAAQRNVGTDTWRKLSDKQQFGLANMAFQMGQPNQAAMLETMKAVKAGDWAKARQQAQYNFFKHAPDKVHSETDWYKTSPTRVVDFQNFITPQSAMPDLPIPKPSNEIDPSLQQAIEASQAQWKELNKPKVEIPEVNPSPFNPFNWLFPNHRGKENTVAKFNYDKELKKRGMQDGGVVHAFMGQEVPRYLADLQDDELEAYLNRYVIPGAENLVYRSGAGGGDGDDLGYAPTAMRPVPDVYTEPEKIIPPAALVPGDVQEIEDVVEPSVFNPWDYEAGITYKYPYSYPDVPSTSSASVPSVPIPSRVDRGFQKELDKKILQNVDSFNPSTNYHLDTHDLGGAGIDPNVMQNVPKSEDLIENLYGSIGSGQGAIPPHSDLLDTINIPYAGKHPGDNPIGDPTFTSAYDQMAQDEIAGSPAYNIPPPPTDYNFGEHDTGEIPVMPGEEITVGDGREDYRPSGFVPTMLEANPYTIGENLELGNIAELEAEYKDAVNTAMLSNPNDPDFEAKQAYVKKAKEKLDAAKSGHKILDTYKDVAPQFGGEPQWIKDAEIRNLIADEQATIDELKARLNDPSLPEEYKEAIKGRIAEIQKSIDAKAAEVQTESQNKLAKLGSKIDNTTEAEIKAKLDSEQGQKVLDEKENKDDNDPEVSKTRQMFDFLFGDLIDGGEIGRAIAVYLASRALGYNHDGSIGFVAKQYLKRVDAKNAQMDKWILANSHLYTKDSLAEFKKTKDPSKLIRIGASPRSTGKKEMQYHKELGQMMAYEFKVKNTAGDDITYWSFDINGLKPELRVGSGWSDENVIDVSLETIGQVNKVLTGIYTARDKHTTGSKDNKKTVYRSGRGSTPGIIPDAIAGETAQWLFDRDIPPGKFLQPLDDAYAALIAANQKLLEDDEDAVLHSSLIPFLEDATIKLRLENMMYKDKDGKMRPLPSPVKATVDGKERTMTNEDLVRIQQRIESVYTAAKSDIFWAEIAAQWKEEAHEDFQDDPKKKKTWREVFMKMAKEKDNAAYTPFGLFAESIIENEIADIGTSLQP